MIKIFCTNSTIKQRDMEKKLESMKHGADFNSKMYSDSNISIGILYTSEIKKEDFYYEDDRYVLIFDGEIFSWSSYIPGEFTTIKILNFLKNNEPCSVMSLNGNYNIFIYDKLLKTLLVLNDRLGLRPLYYSICNGKVIFASEVKAFASDKNFKKDLNIDAIVDFFTYEYIMSNRTHFLNVSVFPHASYVIIDLKECKIDLKKYWDFCFLNTEAEIDSDSEKKYLDQFYNVIMNAVNRVVKDKEIIGIPLSGGLDSRMITNFANVLKKSIKTYTFGQLGSHDVEYAKKISKTLKLDNYYEGIKEKSLVEFMRTGAIQCDAMLSCNHYHILNILDPLSADCDVLLDGYLGDVMSGANFLKRYVKSTDDVFKLYDTIGINVRRLIFHDDIFSKIEQSKKDFLFRVDKLNNTYNDFLDYINLDERQVHFTNYSKVLIRHKINPRTPFADYDFIDFCLTLPKVLRKDQYLYKQIFRFFFPKCARIPKAGRILPLSFTVLEGAWCWRKQKLKSYFNIKPKAVCDYGNIYRTTLKDFVYDTVSSGFISKSPIFNHKSIIELVDSHMASRTDESHLIGALLAFNTWSSNVLN